MIFHIALPADWAQAQSAGVYTVSTRGKTLESEGFIHASDTMEQVETVRAFAYADVDDLLLLVIDESALDAPVIREQLFPHIYGPLPVAAVTEVRTLRPA